MDSTMEEVTRMQQLAREMAAAQDALKVSIAKLEEELKETTAENEAVLKDVAGLKAQNALLDRESDMLVENSERAKEQIALYDSVILPQQLAELKQCQELAKAKEQDYRQKIEQYEKLWEKYETVYNKFPRVAERNALEKEVKLLRIELMKKKQLVLEKAKQAKQMQEIKVRRLEILRAQFLEEYAKEQNMGSKCDKLLQENRVMEARIMEKEAKKLEEQKKLEEEQRKQQELHEQTPQPESDNNQTEDMEAEQPPPSQSCTITIPKFTMPVLDLDVIVPSTHFNERTFPSYSQRPLLTGSPKQGPLTRMCISQPAKVSSIPCDSATLKPKDTILQAKGRDETNPDRSKHNQSKSQPKGNSVNKKESLLSVIKEPVSQPVCEEKHGTTARTQEDISSGNSKKELILSTDNIAAMMKESSWSNPKRSLGTPLEPQAKKIVQVCQEALMTQDCGSVAQEPNEDHCSTELIDSNLLPEDSNQNLRNMLADENEGASSTDCAQDDADIFACDSAENINSPENDQGYDFNAEEYGDDYGSLQSPPPFEGVMSPVHAHFDSSPILNVEGDPPGDEGQMSFGGFNFFSKATSNLFGGQATSEEAKKGKDKSTSGFSFLF